jgi:acyl-CoA synthetase (NDP forming)
MAALDPFLRPASVAIVGASERATSSGGAIVRNMRRAGFVGRIVPVNPKGGTVDGLAAAPGLAALGEPVDLVIVAVRPDLIPAVVEEAAASNHRSLLVLPGGFAEAGPEGVRREAEVAALAQQAGITIGGPNCAGTIHLDPARPFAATFLRDLPPGGGLALVSQSGAIAEQVIAEANRLAIPFGTIVSVGNGLHLGIVDYLAALGDDPECSAVMLYLEAVPDFYGFIDAARLVAAKKPVVALLGGRTPAGGQAAHAHTGGQAMAEAQAKIFCEEADMVQVTSLRRLLLAAKALGAAPEGLGRRVLIISNSGGPGVLTADRLSHEGLELPPLPEALAARLREALPAEATVANPLDLLADAREDRFGATLEAVRDHAGGAFDAVLMIHIVPFMVEGGPVVERLATLAPTLGVPVFHAMMGTLPDKAAWFAALEAAGVAMFDDAEEMAEATGLASQILPIRTSPPA